MQTVGSETAGADAIVIAELRRYSYRYILALADNLSHRTDGGGYEEGRVLTAEVVDDVEYCLISARSKVQVVKNIGFE